MNVINNIFYFCCATMAELGNIFGISYQKANVILFCYVEPLLFCFSLSSLVYYLLHGPAYQTVGKVSLWVIGITIMIVLILLGVSAIRVLPHIGDIRGYLHEIYSGVEPSFQLSSMFKNTVDWLDHAAEIFHTTYETINIWVYILIMPAGILASMITLIIKVYQ